MARAAAMLATAEQRRDASNFCGSEPCCAMAACLWFFYTILSVQELIGGELMVPQVRRTARDVSHMRLPNLYLCPADRARTDPVRWRSFDCRVTYKGEKATCDANLQAYKGETPDDLDGRRKGKGACVEFSTHQIMVMSEWSAAWNEITLRATFDPGTMFDHTRTDVLQEVELGYRPAEQELGGAKPDKYYYPLLRVPVFYMGAGIPPAGVATRAFLGKEVDRQSDFIGRYWYVYGGMQVPLLNASLPKKTLFENGKAMVNAARDSGDSISGIVHIVLSIEDFESYGYQAVPFLVPLLKALGQIAGVGALMTWIAFRCRGTSSVGMIGRIQEFGTKRGIVFSELDTDREFNPSSGDQSDLEDSNLLQGSRRQRLNDDVAPE